MKLNARKKRNHILLVGWKCDSEVLWILYAFLQVWYAEKGTLPVQ